MEQPQDKKPESDGGDDLVADECLNLSKKKSIVYKEECNDIEMLEDSALDVAQHNPKVA